MPRKLTGRVEYRNGRWVARIRGRYLGTFDTEAEARQRCTIAAEVIRERDRAPLTLARFAGDWLDQRELSGVAGIRQERSVWRAHLADSAPATLPLRSVRPRHVADFAADLAQRPAMRVRRRQVDGQWVETREPTGQPLSRATARKALKLLYLAFEGARIAGHTSRNPAEGIRVPRMRRRVVESHHELADSPELVSYLEPAEIERVLALLDPQWSSLYAVAIYCGLRKGELLALRWEDVVLGDRARLRVRRSNEWAGVKSTAGVRDVPLLTVPWAHLRVWQTHGDVRRAVGPVWPTRDGSMRRAGDPLRWADKRYVARQGPRKGELVVQEGIRTQAGVRPHLRFHDLRHTCASHLVMGTWTPRPLSLQEVRDWLGHSNIAVTQRYAHLSPGGLHDLTEAAPEGKKQQRGSDEST